MTVGTLFGKLYTWQVSMTVYTFWRTLYMASINDGRHTFWQTLYMASINDGRHTFWRTLDVANINDGRYTFWQTLDLASWWNQNHAKKVYPSTTPWLPFQKVFAEDLSSGLNLSKTCHGACASPQTNDWCVPIYTKPHHCRGPKTLLFCESFGVPVSHSYTRVFWYIRPCHHQNQAIHSRKLTILRLISPIETIQSLYYCKVERCGYELRRARILFDDIMQFGENPILEDDML